MLGDVEILGDAPILKPFHEQCQDLQFSRSEALRSMLIASLAFTRADLVRETTSFIGA